MNRLFLSNIVSARARLAGCLAAICLGVFFSPVGRADEIGDGIRHVSEKHAAALVTVKFLLRMESQYGKRETESEITGIMIDPKGLVLCANSKLGAPRRFGSVTPTDIKVLIGDDIDGLPARVMARDSELDLAWVQVKEPGDKTFDFLDLERAAAPQVGDRIFALRRMAKFFDRAPLVSEGRIAGRTKKPRELIIPTYMALDAGQPVFTERGEVAGIAVLQLPEDDEYEANPMAFAAMGRDLAGGLILPTAQVKKATERARLTDQDEDDSDESAATTTTPDKKESDNDDDDDE